ncbi:hypothetical protein [Blastopirellula marina]|uniref:Uncharacterized protein n=1 Tax=Blastopirellula marina TaxID=124 RepID=A0A2S8GMC2_9BACT|nr:hypothetical protein [Blastopirellula marina]PQO45587.1 hypothetical protein C5Y93_14195 [Blastopirellula marina]
MKFSITGWASNGTPVSRLVEFPDEAAVRAYANSVGITLSKIKPVPDPLPDPPVTKVQGRPPTEGEYLDSVARILFTFGWLCLLLSVVVVLLSLVTLQPLFLLINILIPPGLFLILIAVIYRVGGSIVRAIEAQQK